MSDLYGRSIEIILENQSPGGAYPACPNFPTYRYSWFRDGAFIAYAMNLAGEHESAQRFHDWASANVINRAGVIERAISKVRQGQPLEGDDILHTRYTVNGGEAAEHWPNFQLDGFGAWLWAIGEHQRLSKTVPQEEWVQAARLMADYLAALWKRPCFDCWEEFPEQIHPYSLAAIYAGLQSLAAFDETDYQPVLDNIRRFLLDRAVVDGRFVKFIGSNAVDASLIGLAAPYRVVEPTDPLMLATVNEIETSLWRGGGVHRYAEDTYYGGGEWVLLAAWLGWYYSQIDEMSKAEAMKRWVEAQADRNGYLAEQIPATLNDESYYEPWLKRWGEIAKPLLWSHAKYIILSEAISKKR